VYHDIFTPCETTAEDEAVEVIIFQVVMVIVGGFALYKINKRKRLLKENESGEGEMIEMQTTSRVDTSNNNQNHHNNNNIHVI